MARSYGRQTDRAAEIVRLVGYVAGGRRGVRLLARLCVACSDDTVRRRVRQKLRGSIHLTAKWIEKAKQAVTFFLRFHLSYGIYDLLLVFFRGTIR